MLQQGCSIASYCRAENRLSQRDRLFRSNLVRPMSKKTDWRASRDSFDKLIAAWQAYLRKACMTTPCCPSSKKCANSPTSQAAAYMTWKPQSHIRIQNVLTQTRLVSSTSCHRVTKVLDSTRQRAMSILNQSFLEPSPALIMLHHPSIEPCPYLKQSSIEPSHVLLMLQLSHVST